MKLSTYLEEALKKAETGMTVEAREVHKIVYRHLAQNLGDVDVLKLTAHDTDLFSRWLSENFSESTAKAYLAVAMQALRPYLQFRHISDEDVRQLVAAAPDDEWRALLMLIGSYDVHIDDALGLVWKNVMVREGELRYRAAKSKADIRRTLKPEALAVLERLSQGKGGVLFSRLRHQKKARLLEMSETIATQAGFGGDSKLLSLLRKLFL